MFIGHFTERPYQDPKSGYFGATGLPIQDLTLSNEIYDAQVGSDLYNRYLDERVYAEEVGFDGIMLNEHHNAPFCMQAKTNVFCSILAAVTDKLTFTSGMALGYGGVFVGSPPNFSFIPDADGDDKPDGPPQVLLDGWGITDRHETLSGRLRGYHRDAFRDAMARYLPS